MEISLLSLSKTSNCVEPDDRMEIVFKRYFNIENINYSYMHAASNATASLKSIIVLTIIQPTIY